MTTQDIDEWRDVQEVNNAILITICFRLKVCVGQNRNEWFNVQELNISTQINIAKKRIGNKRLNGRNISCVEGAVTRTFGT